MVFFEAVFLLCAKFDLAEWLRGLGVCSQLLKKEI
jgi:hypothetical protein